MKKILLFSLLLAFANGFVFAKKTGPSADEVIDKHRIKNYWFHVKIWKEYSKICNRRSIYIDNVWKWIVWWWAYFIYRWDEADIPQHTFEITCPLIAKWTFVYTLYWNKNQTIIIDSCKNEEKYKRGYTKTEIWEDALWKKDKICFFHHPDLEINTDKTSLYVRKVKEIDLKKVLPNKLMFDSYAKPAMLSVILFFLVLSFLFWKERF